MKRSGNVPALSEEEAAAALTRLGEDATVEQMQEARLSDGVRAQAGAGAGEVKRHYSEAILDELVHAHGWERSSTSMSLRKTFSAYESGTGKLVVREYIAQHRDAGQRYLAFEAGWLGVFDIDCRDRDIQGVAIEFDRRATLWSVREIAMPTLPAYARKSLDELAREQRGGCTAAQLDELLDVSARSVGLSVDSETRLNAQHEAYKRFTSFPKFHKESPWPKAEVVARDERDRVSVVAYAGIKYLAQGLVDALATGPADTTDRVGLEAAMIAFGVGPGRAFDLAHSPNFGPADAAITLCEVLDTTPLRVALRPEEPYIRRQPVGELVACFVSENADAKKTMDFAVANYGYLVGRNETIGLGNFADRIAEHYDQATPQNAEVLRVIRQCATYPMPIPLAAKRESASSLDM